MFAYTHIKIPPTSNLRKFRFWGHLFDVAGSELWSKYILENISVLGIYFKQNFVLIANMQIICNKTDSESVYLLKYIQKSLFCFANR